MDIKVKELAVYLGTLNAILHLINTMPDVNIKKIKKALEIEFEETKTKIDSLRTVQ